MKRYVTYDAKKQNRSLKDERRAGGFRCAHCREWVVINEFMGTANRNHCNRCLWSKHVDAKKGDRMAVCRGGMQPIGLTFKHEGYGKVGELMLVHQCVQCAKISINRIASDDDDERIVVLFHNSLTLPVVTKKQLTNQRIILLDETDENELRRQLFGDSGAKNAGHGDYNKDGRNN